MVEPRIQLAQAVSNFIEASWAKAGIDPAYSDAMRLAMAPEHGGPAISRPSQDRLPLLTLPGLCCEALGGTHQQAETITAAWSLLYAAADLLDDAEDGDTGAGALFLGGPGSAINVATGLIVSASLVLGRLDNLKVGSSLDDEFYRTVLKMCAGQHADLTVFEPTLEQCWQKVEDKSGMFFALACRSGARLVTDDAARIDLLGEYGRQLGVLIQVGNDLSSLWPGEREPSDLATGRSWTLPVAYAMTVIPEPERGHLRQWLQAASADPSAEEAARRMIIESGAVLYLTIEAEQRRRQAETALKAAVTASMARDELLALLLEAASSGMTRAATTSDGGILHPPALE